MANMRKLYDEFKDALKKSDASVDEFLENIKSDKSETLILLSGSKSLDECCKLDLFLLQLVLKGIELTIKLENGCGSLEELKLLFGYQLLVERMQEEQEKFYTRSAEKMFKVPDLAMGLLFQKIENCIKTKFGQK